jgi:hypothetical protein
MNEVPDDHVENSLRQAFERPLARKVERWPVNVHQIITYDFFSVASSECRDMREKSLKINRNTGRRETLTAQWPCLCGHSHLVSKRRPGRTRGKTRACGRGGYRCL